MKKLFCMLCALVLVLAALLLPCCVAEGAEMAADVTVQAAPAAANEPFTWAYLGTISGATVATLLIVQYVKMPIDNLILIPTRLLVYLVALIILLVSTGFTVGLDAENGVLAVLNAFIVAMAAMGAYENTFAKYDK